MFQRESKTIMDTLMQMCPKDLSCMIKGIKNSPWMPGNIAVVVQLLHNISTTLTKDVNEEKMQVSGLADPTVGYLFGGRNLG